MRMFSRLSNDKVQTSSIHFVGLPPSLTSDLDLRKRMESPLFLIIEQRPEGYFLDRYDLAGKCVGDTWHLTKDDARNQASYEFGVRVEGWVEIPPTVEDVVDFGLANIASAPKS